MASRGRSDAIKRKPNDFVFGSSTPRELSHMNSMPVSHRAYDFKCKPQAKSKNQPLRHYMRQARSATRHQSVDSNSSSERSRATFAFGSSTPRVLSHLSTVTPHLRVYTAPIKAHAGQRSYTTPAIPTVATDTDSHGPRARAELSNRKLFGKQTSIKVKGSTDTNAAASRARAIVRDVDSKSATDNEQQQQQQQQRKQQVVCEKIASSIVAGEAEPSRPTKSIDSPAPNHAKQQQQQRQQQEEHHATQAKDGTTLEEGRVQMLENLAVESAQPQSIAQKLEDCKNVMEARTAILNGLQQLQDYSVIVHKLGTLSYHNSESKLTEEHEVISDDSTPITTDQTSSLPPISRASANDDNTTTTTTTTTDVVESNTSTHSFSPVSSSSRSTTSKHTKIEGVDGQHQLEITHSAILAEQEQQITAIQRSDQAELLTGESVENNSRLSSAEFKYSGQAQAEATPTGKASKSKSVSPSSDGQRRVPSATATAETSYREAAEHLDGDSSSESQSIISSSTEIQREVIDNNQDDHSTPKKPMISSDHCNQHEITVVYRSDQEKMDSKRDGSDNSHEQCHEERSDI